MKKHKIIEIHVEPSILYTISFYYHRDLVLFFKKHFLPPTYQVAAEDKDYLRLTITKYLTGKPLALENKGIIYEKP